MEEIITKIKEVYNEKYPCKHLHYPAKTPAPHHCIDELEKTLRRDLKMKPKIYEE